MRRLATMALLVVTSCGSGAVGDPAFVLDELRIEGPRRLAEGPLEIEVTNQGKVEHTLVVTTEDGSPLAATGLLGPGEGAILPIHLEEGTYSFTCRIVTEDPGGNLIDHFEMGMGLVVMVEG